MERINYEIENRESMLAQIASDGKIVVEDVTIDLDENGRLTNCYFDVVDAPPPTEESDMQAALELLGVEPIEEG